MAARKRTPAENTALTFKIGEVQYRLLGGQGRDFLQCKPKDGVWSIMSDPETVAIAARLEETAKRLTPAQ